MDGWMPLSVFLPRSIPVWLDRRLLFSQGTSRRGGGAGSHVPCHVMMVMIER